MLDQEPKLEEVVMSQAIRIAQKQIMENFLEGKRDEALKLLGDQNFVNGIVDYLKSEEPGFSLEKIHPMDLAARIVLGIEAKALDEKTEGQPAANSDKTFTPLKKPFLRREN